MSQADILHVLEQVKSGELEPKDAMTRLKLEPFQDLGYAKVDHHRELRQGVAEVIYGAGKTPEQIIGIAEAMRSRGQKTILITRLSQEAADTVAAALPLSYNALARVGIIGELPEPDGDGTIVVATGGTSDMPVAEEAAVTAEALGNRVVRLYDVGVSGIHRLLRNMEPIMQARCIVAVAGMEGALPAVIGGLADCPVIAVPTSVGYGASLGGIAALNAAFVQMSEEMRRDLRSIASVDKRICVGTSIMEKVRLLYELWVLYSEEEKDCEIQMVNIEMGHDIPAEVELIESVNSGVAWMREWEFLEICRVPFGFAVVKDHPLASRSVLRLEDLRHETVVTLNDGSCDAVADLLELLKRSYISVQNPSLRDSNLLWESAFRRDALLVPMCWSDILINMTVLPFEQEFLLPYGIFYRAETHPAVSRFLDFIRQTYREGNARDIVPVLT